MITRIAGHSTSKSSPISRHLFLMMVALVLIISLMLFLQRAGRERLLPGPGASGVSADRQTYRNSTFGFSIKAPHAGWAIEELTLTASLSNENALLPVMENTIMIVKIAIADSGTVIAQATVGVLKLSQARLSGVLAAQSLQQIIEKYHAAKDSVAVILPVSRLEANWAEGSYFVVGLPEKSIAIAPAFDIWIMTYLVRREIAYAIFCQTSRADYAGTRDDLTALIESFRFL